FILLEDFNDKTKLEKNYKQDRKMARQRHIYETAFDCKINRSNDDIDDLDRVTNHPLLISHLRDNSSSFCRTNSSIESSKRTTKNLQQITSQVFKDHRCKFIFHRKTGISNQSDKQEQEADNISKLTQDIKSLKINLFKEKSLLNREYTSSASPAPISTKFYSMHKREQFLLKIHKISNLNNQHQLVQSRSKDMNVFVDSIPQAPDYSHRISENNIYESKNRPKNSFHNSKEFILEFKDKPIENVLIQRVQPRSIVCESKSIKEFKDRPHKAEIVTENQMCRNLETTLLEFKLDASRRNLGYSSTESITSSSCGSMESLRSSNSEDNRSISSNESGHSISFSSHSSDSDTIRSYLCPYHNHQQLSSSNFLCPYATKLEVRSSIQDTSLRTPASEISDNLNSLQKTLPEEFQFAESNQIIYNGTSIKHPITSMDTSLSLKKRRISQNKNLIDFVLQSSLSSDQKIQGSDSGISIESRAEITCNKTFDFHLLKISSTAVKSQEEQYFNVTNQLLKNEQQLSNLPFDMPKLCRPKLLMQQDITTSGSVTNVDFTNLPFDMPKLKRRLKCMQNTESTVPQTSNISFRNIEASIFDIIFNNYCKIIPISAIYHQFPFYNFIDERNGIENESLIHFTNVGDTCEQLTLKKSRGLNLVLSPKQCTTQGSPDFIDVELPLERQGWYHGSITRIEAEAVLRLLQEGSYLVRNSESTKQDYSLSLKSARGFMHMRIQKNKETNAFILGQFSKPFDNIPKMVRHFTINQLPIRGAEHMCLLHPVIVQLL
ncbi:PREDICTED: uncharacterized protein LOC105365833, partial [Ceratosolen solmsi marchali]|uniref:SH2 domain-containing adapter protein D n=1 Tax=Ceratosolen solmsi marchali TaxID=326594 RepID=A0AAJ7DZR7_9HYME